jgi:hypothetical protein
MLDYVMELVAVTYGQGYDRGTNPDNNEEVAIKPDEKAPFVVWHLRLPLIRS